MKYLFIALLVSVADAVALDRRMDLGQELKEIRDLFKPGNGSVIDQDVCWRDGSYRGQGRLIHSCAAHLEMSGLLCYPRCAPGQVGMGPMCVNQKAKKITWRGPGVPLMCSPGENQMAGLCFKQCPQGQKGFMGRCVQNCPSSASFKCNFNVCAKDILSCIKSTIKLVTFGLDGLKGVGLMPGGPKEELAAGQMRVFQRGNSSYSIPSCRTAAA